ncbi:hypothetical protein COO60DRAFT_724204 [Scenedesmus sp. NREL 46B-D3]|nr:hypothetical protein COO60DRAFT_724204 [Scenedesmus sp. NREL 46B-D3]
MTPFKGWALLFSATVLLATCLQPAAAQQDPLGLIAPGLTAEALCPLVKSNPTAVINAIATGAIKAYDQGKDAIAAYASAMGAAVVAANSNGCINEVFEGVNQAIIKGGYKVEVVVGVAPPQAHVQRPGTRQSRLIQRMAAQFW